MGFLDQSTNNIILDAVLTDKGREFLARNDGSFNISKFAFGDDEVDYTIIEKFGRTVGKEKIEKNTPVLEAITNGDHSLKYKLVSLSRPNLTKIPKLSLKNRTTSTVDLNIVDGRSDSIVLAQSQGTNEEVPVELVDQVFQVTMKNDFVQPAGGLKPVSIDSEGNATYLIQRDAALSSTDGGSSLSIKLGVKSTLTNTVFSTKGTQTDKNKIETTVCIKGLQSGQVFDVPVSINKKSSS
jgi:hypothetical protein